MEYLTPLNSKQNREQPNIFIRIVCKFVVNCREFKTRRCRGETFLLLFRVVKSFEPSLLLLCNTGKFPLAWNWIRVWIILGMGTCRYRTPESRWQLFRTPLGVLTDSQRRPAAPPLFIKKKIRNTTNRQKVSLNKIHLPFQRSLSHSISLSVDNYRLLCTWPVSDKWRKLRSRYLRSLGWVIGEAEEVLVVIGGCLPRPPPPSI